VAKPQARPFISLTTVGTGNCSQKPRKGWLDSPAPAMFAAPSPNNRWAVYPIKNWEQVGEQIGNRIPKNRVEHRRTPYR